MCEPKRKKPKRRHVKTNLTRKEIALFSATASVGNLSGQGVGGPGGSCGPSTAAVLRTIVLDTISWVGHTHAYPILIDF